MIVDVAGVGYEVTIPLSTFYSSAMWAQTFGCGIYTYVREDALQLFGFKTAENASCI